MTHHAKKWLHSLEQRLSSSKFLHSQIWRHRTQCWARQQRTLLFSHLQLPYMNVRNWWRCLSLAQSHNLDVSMELTQFRYPMLVPLAL
jgi:hypothetical protein